MMKMMMMMMMMMMIGYLMGVEGTGVWYQRRPYTFMLTKTESFQSKMQPLLHFHLPTCFSRYVTESRERDS